VAITVSGAAGLGSEAAIDPDILVFRRGQLVLLGESAEPNREDIASTQLAAGTYVIEVYDFQLKDDSQPRCMSVSITGT
jgi:hypothetical protein